MNAAGYQRGHCSLAEGVGLGLYRQAVTAGHVEKVAMMLVKSEFDGVVLYPSCSRDIGKIIKALGDGFEFCEFHERNYIQR